MNDRAIHATTGGKKKPRGAGGGRGDLTVQLIIDTARDLARESSFERLSVKELAGKLNVRPPAIYYHLANKSHLLSMLAEQILRDVQIPPESLEWKERLRLVIMTMRDTFVAYPGLGRYMLCNGHEKANALWHQKHMRVLRDAGFTPRNAARAMMVLQCYINPLNTLDNPDFGDRPLAARKIFRRYVREDPVTFDALGEVLPSMRDIPYRAMYEIGIRPVIAGLEKQFLQEDADE